MKVALAAGGEVWADVAEGAPESGPVTVIVRPENASVSTTATAGLSGTVDNVVYFGTDTHIHLKLNDGSPFTLRRQNVSGQDNTLAVGDTVNLALQQVRPA